MTKKHYSTAYDLAMITREALKNPVFTEVVSTKRTVIPWESREDEDRILLNQNRLLSRMSVSRQVLKPDIPDRRVIV